MRRSGALGSVLPVLVSAALLLWPAVLNGYPLLFGDTGVYISDGIHHHMSWARPLFYGLFMLPLHLKTTTWSVIVAQGVITATLLLATLRCFLPSVTSLALIPITLALAVGTSLPWFVSQLMPDLFGSLMLLALALLLLRPAPLGPTPLLILLLFAAGCVTTHLSFLPVSLTAVVALWAARVCLRLPLGAGDILAGLAVPALGAAVVLAANVALMGQASVSPYGKIFLLNRILVDGPGQRALDRECPRPGWTLCDVRDEITADDHMLWGDDSVLNQAGGYKVVAPQAWPIIRAAWHAEPGEMLLEAVRNTADQFVSFRTGDGLLRPSSFNENMWASEFPPAEQARYRAGRQFRLLELVPDWLQFIHLAVGAASIVALFAAGLPALTARRPLGGLCAAVLAGLFANAFVAGALSGVFDRYQSRFVWLAPFAALLVLWDRAGPGRRRLR